MTLLYESGVEVKRLEAVVVKDSADLHKLCNAIRKAWQDHPGREITAEVWVQTNEPEEVEPA